MRTVEDRVGWHHRSGGGIAGTCLAVWGVVPREAVGLAYVLSVAILEEGRRLYPVPTRGSHTPRDSTQ